LSLSLRRRKGLFSSWCSYTACTNEWGWVYISGEEGK
jgi:hypothetical protein